jgi:hypothetical protein
MLAESPFTILQSCKLWYLEIIDSRSLNAEMQYYQVFGTQDFSDWEIKFKGLL